MTKTTAPYIFLWCFLVLFFTSNAQDAVVGNSNTISAASCVSEYFIKTYSRNDATSLIHDFTVTGTNKIIAGGETAVYTPGTHNDAVLMKLNANGERIWEKHFSQPGYQRIMQVETLANGDFIAIGQDVFDMKQSFFLVKFDENGNLLWKRTYEYTDDCNFYIHQVKEDIDGSLIAVGYHLERCRSFQDRFVWLKFSSDGSMLSAKSLTPPAGANLTRVSDFIIKNGYSYLSGYLHYGTQFKGVLMKVNNSNGVVAWSKSYGYSIKNVQFSQIFAFGEKQVCLIGSNDINYTDTSLLVVCDTSGAVVSSKYYTYASNRDLGKAAIDDNGDLTWFNYSLYENNNQKNELTITKLHPVNGVQRSRRYPQLYDGLYFAGAYRATDGSMIFGGSNLSSAAKYQIFLGRISSSGELACAPVDLQSAFGEYPIVNKDVTYSTVDKNFSEITRNWTTENSFIDRIDTLCQLSLQCSSLKITGPASLCTADTLVIQIQKNNGCVSEPQFIYNQDQLRLISQSITDVRFLVKDSGNCWVKAKLQMACGAIWDSLMVRLNEGKGPLQLIPDTSLCLGNTIVINATKGYSSYEWQDGLADSTYKVTKPGLYFVTVMDGCSRIYEDSVLVTTTLPIAFDAGPDRTKCDNDTLHLNAPAGFLNYTWSNNYNLSSTSSQHVTVSPLIDTVYYVKAEKTPGCFAFDTVRIKVNTSPPISLGMNQSFCSGDSVVLKAGVGFSEYTWSNGGHSEQITVKTSGFYSVIGVTPQGCRRYDTVKLDLFSNPVVSLDHTNFLCTGSARTLDAGNFSLYNWSDGSSSQKITVNDIGVYAVEVTDNNGCKARDTARITNISSLPSNFLLSDTVVCSYDKITISSPNNYISYQWNTGVFSSSLTISQPGTYWLQVKDAKGCIGRDSISVNSKDCLEGVFIPTAFTPNNDGKNDVFQPRLFGNVKNYQFSVYNRWGQCVFQTTQTNKGWDGKVAGFLQQTNVFIWVCTYQFEGEEMKIQKGSVALIQ